MYVIIEAPTKLFVVANMRRKFKFEALLRYE